jgi:prephenate dehydratase
MPSTTVAFQGEPGAYSELAAFRFFDTEIETLPRPTFDAIFDAVQTGDATHGFVPIENSVAGSIHRNYDHLLANGLSIVGEYHLRVSHCLMALPGVALSEIKRVHSHPQALAQCRDRLRRMGLESVAGVDTAGSARLIRERGDRQAAALASKRAAKVYDLNILIEGMEDNLANYTRFLVIAPESLSAPADYGEEYKTSVVFHLHNQPGALFKALSVFALRDIDLTKIESRPIPGKPWEYMFYIDYIGHAEEYASQRALDHLGELASFIRVLGSYPRHRILNEHDS